MGSRDLGRVGLMLLGLSNFLAALTFNTLAGFGAKSGVFLQSTEDVTLKYTTPLTPAAWSLFIWDFIYFWVFAMFIYFLSGLCRRSALEWMYSSPSVLPYGFHVSLVVNMSLNISWMFLFDRELLLPALCVSGFMTLSVYMILFFCCRGLKVYGAWLHKYHRLDLWLIRTLVQNGAAVYATWGTISTLHHFTIYLEHQTPTPLCDCAMLSLMLLLMLLLAWFLLENFYLDEHVRYVVTVYPVVILWLSGSVTNSVHPASYIHIFKAVILASSCCMFPARLSLVVWRHLKQPLYANHVASMSPVEIALTQRSVFL